MNVLRWLRDLLRNSSFARFLVTGAINTVFGLSCYLVLLRIGLPPWASLLCAHIAGVLFNFFTIGGYAFRGLALHRLPRFVIGYGLTYCINLSALDALAPCVASAAWRQVILTPPMAAVSFLIMSRFVFGRRRAARAAARLNKGDEPDPRANGRKAVLNQQLTDSTVWLVPRPGDTVD